MDKNLVDWHHLEQKHLESFRNIEKNVPVNLTLYQLMMELAPPNMKVVWIATPRNRDWESTLNSGGYPQVYMNALEQLEAWSGHPVIVVDSDLNARHYVDHGHIVTPIGRRISTDRLLRAVEELTGITK